MTPAQFSDTFPHNAEYPGFRLSLFPKPPSSFVHSAECYWNSRQRQSNSAVSWIQKHRWLCVKGTLCHAAWERHSFFSLINLAAATLSAHGTSMCHVIVSYFYTGWQVQLRRKWPNTAKYKKSCKTETHQTNATEKWQKHINPGNKVTQNSPQKNCKREIPHSRQRKSTGHYKGTWPVVSVPWVQSLFKRHGRDAWMKV